MESGSLTAGLGGVKRNGCVALAAGPRILGVCPQERATRVRHVGFNSSGLPDEALDLMLARVGRTRDEVSRYAIAEVSGSIATDRPIECVDHHLAHACAAYLTSPFAESTILVCDSELPKVSVWEARGSKVRDLGWPWRGPGFTDVYSDGAKALGFWAEGGAFQFEALARLCPNARDASLQRAITGDGASLTLAAAIAGGTRATLSRPPGNGAGAQHAAAFQTRLGELFIELLMKIRSQVASANLCVAGSLFYHSSINTLAKTCGVFDRVFVPLDPGNGGLAVGTALRISDSAPRVLTPFLGPSYSIDEIKATLDNCKLQYALMSQDEAIEVTLQALLKGQLVGWFQGPMEWGPRTLGGRSILANPFAPYVLDNLNHFLKHRQSWRGYAMSGLEAAVADHFDGPASAPFMESDYQPRDRTRFRHALPSADAAVRVHSVAGDEPAQFRTLLEEFGRRVGSPFLINTSFNGFQEPIVCSPRDAIRVFFGSGLDVLVLDRFILTK